MQAGSIVIIDNLPAHKVAGIRECLESAGMHLLYLPPYSPDFNPIEQVFSKIKGLIRQMNPDRKSTRLNSSHQIISYAVFCLKKKKKERHVCEANIRQNVRSLIRRPRL